MLIGVSDFQAMDPASLAYGIPSALTPEEEHQSYTSPTSLLEQGNGSEAKFPSPLGLMYVEHKHMGSWLASGEKPNEAGRSSNSRHRAAS